MSAVYLLFACIGSRVAQWKRAGPITQRSEDQNLALLRVCYFLLHFTSLNLGWCVLVFGYFCLFIFSKKLSFVT